MAHRKEIENGFQQQRIRAIYLGIDFGTSYSKVSFSQPAAEKKEAQIQTLKWEEDGFYKKSSLWLYNNSLYFIKPNDSAKEIKYFKYSIIDKTLIDNSVYHIVGKLQNNFEEMCCVYFLAQLIKRSLAQICKIYMLGSLDDINVYVNMGVPLENYNEKNKANKGKYETILNNAVCLAGGSKVNVILPENQVTIESLDKTYSMFKEKEAILYYHTNLFPELAAEVLLYQQSNSIGEGVYSIIDIGGGTVDMAAFQKLQNNNTREFDFCCHAQKILPFGLEILNMKRNQNIDIKKEEEEYICTFYYILSCLRKGLNDDKYKKTDVFFLGGGYNEEWYIDNINGNKWRLENTLMRLGFDVDIKDFIINDSRLIEKEQRLIISQMLAQQPDDIATVKGFPSYHEAIRKQREEEQKKRDENRVSQDDILREKGFADI